MIWLVVGNLLLFYKFNRQVSVYVNPSQPTWRDNNLAIETDRAGIGAVRFTGIADDGHNIWERKYELTIYSDGQGYVDFYVRKTIVDMFLKSWKCQTISAVMIE